MPAPVFLACLAAFALLILVGWLEYRRICRRVTRGFTAQGRNRIGWRG